MALKLDGKSDDHMILANEILIPDLNVVNYLKKLYYQKYQVGTIELKNGKLLEVKFYEAYAYNNEVSIDCEPVPDGTFEIMNEQKQYFIKNSRIDHIIVKQQYKTNNGEVIIHRQQGKEPCVGDLVYKNGKPAPDGKYKAGLFEYFNVREGQIV